MLEEDEKNKKKKMPKKITPQRLKNIALYYLKRFDSSVENLRQVLLRRVNDYAYYNKDWDKSEALGWIENLLDDFIRYGYLDDIRYAEIKVKDYLAAGKPLRYISGKLKQKGITEDMVLHLAEGQAYSPAETARIFARKKRIGPYRESEEKRAEYRQKDMGTLLRAGFDYDTVSELLNSEV